MAVVENDTIGTCGITNSIIDRSIRTQFDTQSYTSRVQLLHIDKDDISNPIVYLTSDDTPVLGELYLPVKDDPTLTQRILDLFENLEDTILFVTIYKSYTRITDCMRGSIVE